MIRTAFITTLIVICLISIATPALCHKTDTISNRVPKSKLNIDNNNDFTSFSMLDSVVNNYKVFFLGENHQFRTSNLKIELKLLKYLHDKAGVRTLLLEFGYSRGWLLDKYIQTGDTSCFSILDTYSFKVFTDFYKQLYEYNKTLSENEKIHIVGIDAERFLGLPIKLMSLQLPDKESPEEINLAVESLRSLAAFNDSYHKEMNDVSSENNEGGYYKNVNNYSNQNSIRAIIDSYYENKDAFIKYLGDKTPMFEKLIENIETCLKWEKYGADNMVQGYVFRENYMYAEFMKLLKENPNGKYFAQFGRCHASKVLQPEACNWYNYRSIANLLNESNNNEIKNKVMTIGMFYPYSEIYESTAQNYPNLPTLVNNAEEQALTLFKITSDSLFSDFRKKFHFLIINKYTLDDERVAETKIIISNITNDNKQKKQPKISSINHFNISYGYLTLNLDKLNNTLINYNIPKFDNMQKIIGISLISTDENNWFGETAFNAMLPQSKSYGDSLETRLNGYNLMFNLGKNLIHKPIFNITPILGLGYSQLKIINTIKQNNIFLFEHEQKFKYKNPAFVLNAALDLRLKVKSISMGIRVGYQFDCSDYNWKNMGEEIKSSPKTSISGYYGTINVSLFGKNKKAVPEN